MVGAGVHGPQRLLEVYNHNEVGWSSQLAHTCSGHGGIPLAPSILSWTSHIDSTREISASLVGGPEIIKKDYGVTVNQYKGINKSQYQIICAEKVMRPMTTRQCHIRKHHGGFPYQSLDM